MLKHAQAPAAGRAPLGTLVCRRKLRYLEAVRRVSFLLGVSLFSLALHGSAQTKSGGNRAAAEALFNQGRTLMTAGKYAEACPKFEASQELDPGLGTMLNLAECYEKTGRTASAWAEYREAIPLARAAGSKARQDLAIERAQALEERLSTLTIRAMTGDPTDAQLEVRRDGVAVRAAELGAPIPVDPGEHLIEAQAPGHEPWSSKVQVGADAAKVSVDIPKLKPTGSNAAPAAATPIVTTTSTSAPPSDRPATDGSAQRITGLVLGGAGVVGVGLGTFFGLRASSKWSDAKAKCTDYPYGCGSEGTDLRSGARSAGNVSTIAFIAGGALLATGVVLYLTAPTKKESVALSVGPQSVFVQGSF
jgi:serine/threonine-protein kinase